VCARESGESIGVGLVAGDLAVDEYPLVKVGAVAVNAGLGRVLTLVCASVVVGRRGVGKKMIWRRICTNLFRKC
jgi:hypothetical protein